MCSWGKTCGNSACTTWSKSLAGTIIYFFRKWKRYRVTVCNSTYDEICLTSVAECYDLIFMGSNCNFAKIDITFVYLGSGCWRNNFGIMKKRAIPTNCPSVYFRQACISCINSMWYGSAAGNPPCVSVQETERSILS